MPQQQKISGNNTTVYMRGTTQCIMLYSTEIVKHVPSSRHVQFDTGGNFTATTKTRMNQAMKEWGVPLNVIQDNGTWYVTNTNNGNCLRFSGDLCIVGY